MKFYVIENSFTKKQIENLFKTYNTLTIYYKSDFNNIVLKKEHLKSITKKCLYLKNSSRRIYLKDINNVVCGSIKK